MPKNDTPKTLAYLGVTGTQPAMSDNEPLRTTYANNNTSKPLFV